METLFSGEVTEIQEFKDKKPLKQRKIEVEQLISKYGQFELLPIIVLK